PALDPDPAAERPARLSLLRAVRPRLLDALELLVAFRPPAAGAGHRPADGADGGDGPRGHDERRGPGYRGLLRGRGHRTRAAGARRHRDPGRERVRIGPDPPELGLAAVPERPRQRQRGRGSLPDRLDGHARPRLSAPARG